VEVAAGMLMQALRTTLGSIVSISRKVDEAFFFDFLSELNGVKWEVGVRNFMKFAAELRVGHIPLFLRRLIPFVFGT
jgi:hypothetical protein